MRRDPNIPSFVHDYVDLASPRLGTTVEEASDEFFAPKERLIDEHPAIFVPDKYDDHGKWMDGWETRRRRRAGSDWCVIRLGVRGIIKGVDIDTSHFTGNYPPAASLEGLSGATPPGPNSPWRPLVLVSPLGPNAHHYFSISDPDPVDWLRLQIFPDGGIARLRVHGIPLADLSSVPKDGEVELSALRNGGRVIAFNDAHYGNVSAILSPGRGVNMGDGWETRRRREPGNDWVIVALGVPGIIDRVEVDTAHFKGNFPDTCSIQGIRTAGANTQSLVTQSMFWPELMAAQPLSADSIHTFGPKLLTSKEPVTHVRFNIFPDGGVSRLRLFGRLA